MNLKTEEIILEKKTESFSLESIDTENEKFFFTARSLSKDFECENGLKRLAKDSLNKSLIWRHAHPIQEGNKKSHIYGRVVDSWVVDGYINSKYEVYGHTPEHLALQELIKERAEKNDPLGISMHYRTYANSEGQKIHYDVFEHSGTPIPACIDCKTTKVGINTMVNKEKEEKDEKVKSKEKDEELEDEDELDEHLEKIKELEELLNSKTSKLEDYQSTITKLEKEIEDKKESEMTLEDRVNELKDEVEYLKKKPFIDKIYELENRDSLLDYYKNLSIDDLKKELKEVKKRTAASVQTREMEESAKEADVEDNTNEEEKVSFEEFISQL